MSQEAENRSYRWDERYLYQVPLCEHCGSHNVTVGWVNVGNLADDDQWMPGRKTCHNDPCPTRFGGKDPWADLRP